MVISTSLIPVRVCSFNLIASWNAIFGIVFLDVAVSGIMVFMTSSNALSSPYSCCFHSVMILRIISVWAFDSVMRRSIIVYTDKYIESRVQHQKKRKKGGPAGDLRGHWD